MEILDFILPELLDVHDKCASCKYLRITASNHTNSYFCNKFFRGIEHVPVTTSECDKHKYSLSIAVLYKAVKRHRLMQELVLSTAVEQGKYLIALPNREKPGNIDVWDTQKGHIVMSDPAKTVLHLLLRYKKTDYVANFDDFFGDLTIT